MNILYSRQPSARGEIRPVLLIHGGAGPRTTELALQAAQDYRRGLQDALDSGRSALVAGQSALDAVCAAVMVLEDNPLFNAGRGASLTREGTAELDAAVMDGDGRAGAVAVSRYARNPVLAARAVLERTDHVLLVSPTAELAAGWYLATVEPDYFVTAHRQKQLDEVLQREIAPSKSGTVGAVAIDASGGVACATSTGGMVAQAVGRVGDTALIGAGSFASSKSIAVSCTGEGEAFIQGVVGHDIAARVRYGGATLEGSTRATYDEELAGRGATGGTIALTPQGEALIAHNSNAMFAGHWDGDGDHSAVYA
ncbi:isoaspartyl peptidase/L-asparaginase family protein [Allobranchiibius huperziae]|uniref:Beta-aspartyl-peptidase (Threonine type) n=1 Tax=Allobranchiibius huperziae TaxID=1874116 RepID=A0A853DBD3_9MICO|nr:isoaspartyl peptidase/L-asparaginase [Allobranchiibius huperziae]NYJ74866.1 beta-aspartyl-peptidase (threonine type) [Allobranchiibius huperziae]